MKTCLSLIIFLAALIPAFAQTQDNREDVIYMKDGRVLRGKMLEQNYGVSYTIRVSEDSVITVPAAKIDRITKEERPDDRPKPGYKNKGYLFEFQFHLDAVGGGVRMINGYKINQYAILGVGIGLGGIYLSVNGQTINNDAAPYSGFYFPFFLYYSGDILKKDITPFYVLEAGYAVAYDPLPGGADGATYIRYNTINGGPMGSVGFGVRIYQNRKFVFTLSANLDFQYAHTDVYDQELGSYSASPPTNVYAHMVMLMPGLKIGLGLVR
jgi:hypothetical protein